MHAPLPLDKMTIGDKIRTMEYLWDDLCRHAEQVELPAWHGDILSERERNVLAGESLFEEWDSARKKSGIHFCENPDS